MGCTAVPPVLRSFHRERRDHAAGHSAFGAVLSVVSVALSLLLSEDLALRLRYVEGCNEALDRSPNLGAVFVLIEVDVHHWPVLQPSVHLVHAAPISANPA